MRVGRGATVLPEVAACCSGNGLSLGGGTVDIVSVEGVLVHPGLVGPVLSSVCAGAVVAGRQCAVIGAGIWRASVTQRLSGLVLRA